MKLTRRIPATVAALAMGVSVLTAPAAFANDNAADKQGMTCMTVVDSAKSTASWGVKESWTNYWTNTGFGNTLKFNGKDATKSEIFNLPVNAEKSSLKEGNVKIALDGRFEFKGHQGVADGYLENIMIDFTGDKPVITADYKTQNIGGDHGENGAAAEAGKKYQDVEEKNHTIIALDDSVTAADILAGKEVVLNGKAADATFWGPANDQAMSPLTLKVDSKEECSKNEDDKDKGDKDKGDNSSKVPGSSDDKKDQGDKGDKDKGDKDKDENSSKVPGSSDDKDKDGKDPKNQVVKLVLIVGAVAVLAGLASVFMGAIPEIPGLALPPMPGMPMPK